MKKSVISNKEIKFGHFLKFALDNGANFVATGHYAQKLKAKSLKLRVKRSDSDTSSSQLSAPSYILSEAKDENKDQSYFLWTLTHEQLKHVLFPIGHLQKTEVRKLAGKFGLPQETRKDSQGLCFLGKIDMKEFLMDYIEPKDGEVLNLAGEIIGHHRGALFFTIGERHGFTITEKTDKEVPLYVVAKDPDKNTITVAPRLVLENNRMQVFALSDVNWNQVIHPDLTKTYTARVRYRGDKIKCGIKIKGDKVAVQLATFQQGVSLGQSLVLYDDEICIGGGVISNIL
jgi:tRNA-specific 2-thiouridylase